MSSGVSECSCEPWPIFLLRAGMFGEPSCWPSKFAAGLALGFQPTSVLSGISPVPMMRSKDFNAIEHQFCIERVGVVGVVTSFAYFAFARR